MKKAVFLFVLGLAIGLSYPTFRRLAKDITLPLSRESKEEVERRRIERNRNFFPCLNVFDTPLGGARMEVRDCRIKFVLIPGESGSALFDNNSCDVRGTAAANMIGDDGLAYKYTP